MFPIGKSYEQVRDQFGEGFLAHNRGTFFHVIARRDLASAEFARANLKEILRAFLHYFTTSLDLRACFT